MSPLIGAAKIARNQSLLDMQHENHPPFFFLLFLSAESLAVASTGVAVSGAEGGGAFTSSDERTSPCCVIFLFEEFDTVFSTIIGLFETAFALLLIAAMLEVVGKV